MDTYNILWILLEFRRLNGRATTFGGIWVAKDEIEAWIPGSPPPFAIHYKLIPDRLNRYLKSIHSEEDRLNAGKFELYINKINFRLVELE